MLLNIYIKATDCYLNFVPPSYSKALLTCDVALQTFTDQEPDSSEPSPFDKLMLAGMSKIKKRKILALSNGVDDRRHPCLVCGVEENTSACSGCKSVYCKFNSPPPQNF
jgi:hypothetical protein